MAERDKEYVVEKIFDRRMRGRKVKTYKQRFISYFVDMERMIWQRNCFWYRSLL